MSLSVCKRRQNASGPRLLPPHAAVANRAPARQEARTGPRMPASQAVGTPADRAWSAVIAPRRTTLAHPLAMVMPTPSWARRPVRPPPSKSSRRCVVLATIRSATLLGARGRPVTVEVHVGQGLPGFSVVGLPDEVCREARDRVRAALVSSAVSWPNRRVTVNLAPSGMRKGGAGLDLPIAVGLLAAMEVVPGAAVDGLGFVGELGLDGSVRRVTGIVPLGAALGSSPPGVARDRARRGGVVAHGPVRR